MTSQSTRALLAACSAARRWLTLGAPSGPLAVIDTRAANVSGSVAIGARPWGVGLTSDGQKVYAVNGPSNDVMVVDARTMRAVRRVPVGTL